MRKSGLGRHWKGIMVYYGERSISVMLSPLASDFRGFGNVAGGLMSEWRWERLIFVRKKKKMPVEE